MESMDIAKRRRSRLAIAAGLILASLGIARFVWTLVRSRASGDSLPQSFQVQGSSMVPTLFGSFQSARCDRCRLIWLIDNPENGLASVTSVCTHCGDSLRPRIPSNSTGYADERGVDLVTMETLDEIAARGESLQRGDLVAVRQDSHLHVKRLVALPGETMELDESRLLVDGARIEDLLHLDPPRIPCPWFLVDDDRRREASRWHCKGPDGEDGRDAEDGPDGESASLWIRTASGRWRCEPNQSGHWLVYEHRNVHRGQLPSPVWDDDPFNVTVTRKLYSVDRFRLRGLAHTTFQGEIAMWTSRGSRLIPFSFIEGEAFQVSAFDGDVRDSLPVKATRPLALRTTEGVAVVSGLVIERLLEYRLRPHDNREAYPLRLKANEWFLLGDNVPVSVDSREWGPVRTSQLLGRIQSRQPPTRRPVFDLESDHFKRR